MDPVLNELSVAPAGAAAEERLAALTSTLRSLDDVGLARVLRRTRDALERHVDGEMTLREALLKHPQREQRTFLLGRLSKAPFVEEMHRDREAAVKSMIEGAVGTARCHGAVFAYLTNAPAVSLSGHELWEADTIPLSLVRMRVVADEDSAPAAALEQDEVAVLQVAKPEHVGRCAKILRERVLRAVSAGRELWERRGELFPRLDLGPDVEPQLGELNDAVEGFHLVVDALAKLDAALRTWTDGPLEPGMRFSPESHSTLQHSTYGPMRDFRRVDGQTVRFTLHLKLFAGNRRIYFSAYRSEGLGRAHIGYVGPHLATMKYPT